MGQKLPKISEKMERVTLSHCSIVVILTINDPNTKVRNGTSVKTSFIVDAFLVPLGFGGSRVLIIKFAMIKRPRSMKATALKVY